MKLTQELMSINETGDDAHAEATAIIKKHGSSGDDAKGLAAIISDLRAAGFKKSGIVGTLGLKLKKDGVEVYAARDDIDLGDWQAHIMSSKKVAEAEVNWPEYWEGVRADTDKLRWSTLEKKRDEQIKRGNKSAAAKIDAILNKERPKSKVEEAEDVGTDMHSLHADYKYFNKISDKIDGYIDHMDTLFKENSQFMRLIERIGGDEKVVNAARKSLRDLEDEFRHIQMSTGIAYDDKTGTNNTHGEE